MKSTVEKRNILQILLLMIAGESIFLLPFVLPRVFRATYLGVLELSNEDFGWCFSVYGIVAVVSYFAGGWLADYFRPNILMGTALIGTAIGGFYLMSLPSFWGVLTLYGYWGMTTILLFWAAMLKATRIWGGDDRQGSAFGFLEAGRGLYAAVMAMIAVSIFSAVIISDASAEQSAEGMSSMLLYSSAFVFLTGLAVLFLLKGSQDKIKRKSLWSAYKAAMQYRDVWFVMIIVLCSYVGYKCTDFISQYAHDVLGETQETSATIGTAMLYLRAVVAVFFGFLADRTHAIRWIRISMIIMIIGSFLFASGMILPSEMVVFIFSTFVLGIGVYAARALYFALVQEAKIPVHITGVAIGLISVIGYLPDIFMGPLTGKILDEFPGIVGFQLVFLVLSGFAIIGLLTSFQFGKKDETVK